MLLSFNHWAKAARRATVKVHVKEKFVQCVAGVTIRFRSLTQALHWRPVSDDVYKCFIPRWSGEEVTGIPSAGQRADLNEPEPQAATLVTSLP
jgi:hypothetical protein